MVVLVKVLVVEVLVSVVVLVVKDRLWMLALAWAGIIITMYESMSVLCQSLSYRN